MPEIQVTTSDSAVPKQEEATSDDKDGNEAKATQNGDTEDKDTPTMDGRSAPQENGDVNKKGKGNFFKLL